jgi:hypothetical protein
MPAVPSYIVWCKNVIYVNRLRGSTVPSCPGWFLRVSSRLGPKLGSGPVLGVSARSPRIRGRTLRNRVDFSAVRIGVSQVAPLSSVTLGTPETHSKCECRDNWREHDSQQVQLDMVHLDHGIPPAPNVTLVSANINASWALFNRER